MADEACGHIPVLTKEISELLAIQPGEIAMDLTVGLGGHALILAEAIGEDGTLLGIDVDPANLSVAKARLADASCRVILEQANFAEATSVLSAMEFGKVDILLADLGVSSTQLDDVQRGFSFQTDGPLDMRLDPTIKETAADLVNRLKERELADLLYYNAQETASRRIARRICDARRDKRITTTGRLVSVIASALGIRDPSSRKSKLHPATRTFQALRMAVNDESAKLQSLLDQAPDLLRPGGRIGVISFHSVEDKPVKLDFRKRKTQKIYDIVTKKPVVACDEERRSNPRSRSAKLRVAIRR